MQTPSSTHKTSRHELMKRAGRHNPINTGVKRPMILVTDVEERSVVRTMDCNAKVCLQVTTDTSEAGTTYTASAIASEQYPETSFKNAFWIYYPSLVYLTSRFDDRNKTLYIEGFYSKSSTAEHYKMITADFEIMRGLGRRVLCALVQQLPVGTFVELKARGTFHPQKELEFREASKRLTIEEIKQDLVTASKKTLRHLENEVKEDGQYVNWWVNWQVNKALVSYYKHYFGFKAKNKRTDFSFRDLVAQRESIIEHCQSTNNKSR